MGALALINKKCPDCGEVKKDVHFYQDRNKRYGLDSYCKSCRIKRGRKLNRTRKKDPFFRLRNAICVQMRKSVGTWEKGTRWRDCVPWSFEQLVQHLESKFEKGMSWSNYGRWHLDHVTPKASFDLPNTHSQGFKDCWALENLQPLWENQNLIKGKSHFAPMFFDYMEEDEN